MAGGVVNFSSFERGSNSFGRRGFRLRHGCRSREAQGRAIRGAARPAAIHERLEEERDLAPLRTPCERDSRSPDGSESAYRARMRIAIDDDLAGMSRDQLAEEVRKLRDGIRKHRDSTGQELCWRHPELYGAFSRRRRTRSRVVPEWPQFLEGCLKYRQSPGRSGARSSAEPRALRGVIGGCARAVRRHMLLPARKEDPVKTREVSQNRAPRRISLKIACGTALAVAVTAVQPSSARAEKVTRHRAGRHHRPRRKHGVPPRTCGRHSELHSLPALRIQAFRGRSSDRRPRCSMAKRGRSSPTS